MIVAAMRKEHGWRPMVRAKRRGRGSVDKGCFGFLARAGGGVVFTDGGGIAVEGWWRRGGCSLRVVKAEVDGAFGREKCHVRVVRAGVVIEAVVSQ